MSDSLKTPRPSRPPFDSQFEKEESHVRGATPAAEPRKASGSFPAQAPNEAMQAPSEMVGERTARIEHKMSVATLLLKSLSPTDPRARLLGSAILRRDEVLLDAVLSQMTEDVVALVSSRRPGAK